jgi:hypothetical protein
MTPADLNDKIAKLEAAIKSPATPDAQKESFRGILEKLRAMQSKEEPKKEEKKEASKAEPKKRGRKAGTKMPNKEKPEVKKEPKKQSVTKGPASDPYNCDDLISREKERRAKQKAASEKRAEEPKKTPATKNRIAIEKVAERVTANVQKRIDKGEVKRAELEKLIAETEHLLSNLKSALKKL